ncbi:hypothetical protein [Nocardia sp. 348MFTsu5.1]|uniref:hypothetical protein n=1 Tax=Nocardia sp. 348MFTsu5.1 TaxID=1172185 RepID=UPI000375C748|nr:hypothetical protein [Nocardia sp. 348MFTsu5.1]
MIGSSNALDDPNEIQDAGSLLGLHTVAAQILVFAYVVTFAVVSWTDPPPGGFWYEFAAWFVVSIGAVALILIPGDPIPLSATLGLTVVGPIAINLNLVKTPLPLEGHLPLWALGASTAIYAYMCVRGRTLWAWIGMLTTLASCMVWTSAGGEGALYGLSISVINLAPLLMATFFAWTIRPAATSIFELRRQGTLRVAAEAAGVAILEERDARLAELDELARPLLEQMAMPQPLTEEVRLRAKLIEARLRDSLRAPALDTPKIEAAARLARTRGVDVVLLDDHGLDDTPPAVCAKIYRAVTDALDRADTGTLTIRVLPPQRDTLVTVLHSTPDAVTRLEYGHTGEVLAPRL